MLCNKCLGDTECDAVALQKVILTEYKTGGIKRDFAYIPVCEEHKSDSTEVGMVIPLSGAKKAEENMTIQLSDSPCTKCKSNENRDRRIAELKLRLDIVKLENIQCNCPICCAKRTGKESPISGECPTVKRRKELQEQLIALPSIELQCQYPECSDKASLKVDIDNWKDLVDQYERERGIILAFIRQYFTAKPFPGMESEGGYPVNSASDEQLIELIGLSYKVVKSRDDLQEFIDTT